MLELLFIIYLVVGSLSAATNLGNWLFKSKILALPFVPFVIVFYLIKGDKQQKQEAVVILKGAGVFAIIFGFFYFLILFIQTVFLA